MKNILWFCQDFIPSGGVGFVRIAHWMSALQKSDHSLMVISGEKDSVFPEDRMLWRAVDFNTIRSHQIPNHRPQWEGRAHVIKSLLKNTYPEDVFPWAIPAFECAVETYLNNPPDIVVASAPGWDSVWAASLFAREVNCKLIIDYRDPCVYSWNRSGRWLENFQAKAIRFIERQWLEYADSVITVVDDADWVDQDIRVIAKNHFCLPNGYSSMDSPQPPDEWMSEAVNIVFTGKIRDPFMAKWLVKFADVLSKKSNQFIRLHVYGQDMTGTATDTDSVTFHGFHTADEILNIQASADLLLHVLSPEVEARYETVSGKVFEYLGRKAPILVVGPPENLSAKRVTDLKRGKSVFSYDISLAVELAIDLISNASDYSGDQEAVQAYHWENLEEQFLRLFEC